MKLPVYIYMCVCVRERERQGPWKKCDGGKGIEKEVSNNFD